MSDDKISKGIQPANLKEDDEQTDNQRPTADKELTDWMMKVVYPLVEKRYGKGLWRVACLGTLDMHCDCPECNPDMYNACKNGSKHPELVRVDPKMDLDLGHYNVTKHEALGLVDAVIRTFKRPKEQMSEEQVDAIDRFQQQWEASGGWHEAFERDEDVSAYVTAKSLYELASLINTIFFAGSLPMPSCTKSSTIKGAKVSGPSEKVVDIEWGDVNFDGYQALGVTTFDNGKITIEIDRRCYIEKAKEKNMIAESRLGTIVHELIHGFLYVWACNDCHAATSNLRRCNGHGRAWYRMAQAIEDRTKELLGTKIISGRQQEATAAAERGRRGPSLHDLQMYGFLEEEEQNTPPTVPTEEARTARKRTISEESDYLLGPPPSDEMLRKRRELSAALSDSSQG